MLRFQVYKIQLQLLRLRIATWKLAIKVSKLLKPRTWKWITIGQLLAAAIIFNVYQSLPARKPPAPVVMYDNVASKSDLSSNSSATTIKELTVNSFPVVPVSKVTDFYGIFSPMKSLTTSIEGKSNDIGWSIPSIPRYPRQVIVQLSSSERMTLLESTAKLLLLLQTCSMTLGSIVTSVVTVLSYNRTRAEIKLKEMELQLKLVETRMKDQEIRLKDLQIREAELKVEEMTRARVETARNAQTSHIILVE